MPILKPIFVGELKKSPSLLLCVCKAVPDVPLGKETEDKAKHKPEASDETHLFGHLQSTAL